MGIAGPHHRGQVGHDHRLPVVPLKPQTFALASLLTLLLATPALAAPPPIDPTSISLGPFAGVVVRGETDTHHYQNMFDGMSCIDIVQPYTVDVVSTGPVTVTAAHRTFTVDGHGFVTFERGVCTAFDISISGEGNVAAYVVTVRSGVLAAPPGDICNSCIAM